MKKCNYCKENVTGIRKHYNLYHPKTLPCDHPVCRSKSRRFRDVNDIEKHKAMSVSHGGTASVRGVCRKKLQSEKAEKKHEKDSTKHLKCDHPECRRKKRVFSNKTAMESHKKSKHGLSSIIKGSKLPLTTKVSKNKEKSLTQKQPEDEASKMLMNYYTIYALPSIEDRKRSKKLAKEDILKELLKNISDSEDGNLYKGSLEKAGSTSTNTKINVADEFDFDLHLNIGSFSLDKKFLGYKFTAVRLTFLDPCTFRGHRLKN